MTTWLELISRELALLVALTALGSGPVAFLHASHPRVVRWALAPGYGLALGCAVLPTGLYLVPGDKLAWLGLVPLALVSVVLAVRRARPVRPALAEVLPLAVVVGVVLVAGSAPLAAVDSVGPIGGLTIADTAGYTAEVDAAQRTSLRTAGQAAAPLADRTLAIWSGVADGFQQVGFDGLQATLNVVLGLDATDTTAPYLIAVMAVLGLGLFAAVVVLTGRVGWAAVLAGALAAGPVPLQLHLDGSQAALVGLALLPVFGLAAHAALRDRRRADVVLLGLAAAGVQAGYPLWAPPLVLAGGLVLGWLLVVRRAAWRPLAGGILAVLGLVVVFAPLAVARNAEYYANVARGKTDFSTLTPYDLPVLELPGWLAQTREFFDVTRVGEVTGSGGAVWLVAVLGPLLVAALAAFGAVRHRAVLGAGALIVACAALALYTSTAEGCSYCVQRNLLPVVPALVIAAGVGLTALAGRSAVAAGLAAVALVLLVGEQARTIGLRTAQGAYVLDPELRTVLGALPAGAAAAGVHLEGFGAGARPPMEEPLAYRALQERLGAPPSFIAFVDDFSGQLYLGGLRPDPGPELRLDHRYVLSRLGGARIAGRRVLARSGPIVLSERVAPRWATVEGGVRVDASNEDPRGTTWVYPGVPLRFFVYGGGDEPLWVRFRLAQRAGLLVRSGLDLGVRRVGTGVLEGCVQAEGTGPGRLAGVLIDQQRPRVVRQARQRYGIRPASTAALLTDVAVTATDCSPGRR